MVYDFENVSRPCHVVDIEGGPRTIEQVHAIDTELGMVWVTDEPLRTDAYGEIVTRIEQFRVIHPIYGGRLRPVAFHCYR